MSVFMITPHEMLERIAKQAQTKRLALNLSQQTLAERSGVSYGVLKKFERTGQISFKSLLKLAVILGVLEDFSDLFVHTKKESIVFIDDLIKDKARKRGRK